MIIADQPLQPGQTVGFLMSYPEVIDAQPDEDFVNVLNETNKRKTKK
jgi:hypothetical protein